jgi:putative transposase
MALWKIYYHFVWATKYRAPLIHASWETDLYKYVIGKADRLSCIVHAVNGTEDHIHVVATVPPSLSVADFVKNIKGSSSHYRNKMALPGTERLQWQTGYGVFSLGSQQLGRAVAYVENQKQHHAQNQLWQALEPADD